MSDHLGECSVFNPPRDFVESADVVGTQPSAVSTPASFRIGQTRMCSCWTHRTKHSGRERGREHGQQGWNKEKRSMTTSSMPRAIIARPSPLRRDKAALHCIAVARYCVIVAPTIEYLQRRRISEESVCGFRKELFKQPPWRYTVVAKLLIIKIIHNYSQS